MSTTSGQDVGKFLQFRFQAHPWHGIPAESNREGCYNAFIELTPTDGVKYELDKATGHIMMDRPQKFSSLCPTLYGFIPRTYCGDTVGRHTEERLGRKPIHGDGDPLDICVLTEKPISQHGIQVSAFPIGGLRMIDHGQADDKILAVMYGDVTYGSWRSLADVPQGLLDRLRHYFLTYKQLPDAPDHQVEIAEVYDREEALAVINCCLEDYKIKFRRLNRELATFMENLARTVGESRGSESL